MIWIKQGVCGDLHREMRRCLGELESQFGTVFITSKRDGNHIAGSLHYDGKAIDCRFEVATLGVPVADVREAVGLDFDVVEYATHYHIEYDPKGGTE